MNTVEDAHEMNTVEDAHEMNTVEEKMHMKLMEEKRYMKSNYWICLSLKSWLQNLIPES